MVMTIRLVIMVKGVSIHPVWLKRQILRHSSTITASAPLKKRWPFIIRQNLTHSPGHLTSSGADRTVQISSSQVVAVALFLRSINALENIRSSNQLDDQAKLLNAANGREITKLAMADTQDAIRGSDRRAANAVS